MVSKPWIAVLLALHGPTIPSVLARKLRITNPGLTTASDAMERAGLVTTADVAGDRRQVARVLTPEGQAFVAAMVAAFSDEKHTNHTHEPQDQHQLPG